MTLTLDIPDILARALGSVPEAVRRALVEGFSVEAYRSGRLSCAEIRELLGHASRWETEEFLAQHGAWPDPSEVEADMEGAIPLRLASEDDAGLRDLSRMDVRHA